jgi:hypothetical protein
VEEESMQTAKREVGLRYAVEEEEREVGLRFGGEYAVPDEGGASGLADIMRRHMTLQVFGGAAAHRFSCFVLVSPG